MSRFLLPAAMVAAVALATSAGASPLGAIVGKLQAEGYEQIEITIGPSQVKVEAAGGGQTLEVVADMGARKVIERETGTTDQPTPAGIEVSRSDTDFVGGCDGDDDGEGGDDHGSHHGHHGGDLRARR